jgi:flagellar basal body-associated protein FliL
MLDRKDVEQDMAEARMNPVVKYLIIAIAFIAQVLLIAVIAIFVYKTFVVAEQPKDAVKVGEEKVEASYAMEEFQISTIDPGMCKFKVELYLNDKDIEAQLVEQISFIRDNITREAMHYKADEIMDAYRNGTFHQRLHEWLSKNVVEHMGKKKTWFLEKKYEILKVNVFDFQVFKLD